MNRRQMVNHKRDKTHGIEVPHMPQDEMKQRILARLDERIALLEEHRMDDIIVTGNQYEELNQVLKKVIGVPLQKELEDLRAFVQSL